MDGNPPRPPPPPPPQRSPPQSSPPKPRRPPLMQRNSTTGGLAPSQRYDNDTGLRTRTFSADVHEGVTANSNSVTARHHRHTRSKVRFESVDPLLRMSLERPDIEDEAETVSLFFYTLIDFVYSVLLWSSLSAFTRYFSFVMVLNFHLHCIRLF